MIKTVTGEIVKERIGFCHSHEHLFIAEGQPAKLDPALQIDDFGKTLQELMLFHSVGGNSVVDAQPLGCGRMAENLVKVSKKTGVEGI
ncbi:MAG: hypothetical protein DDT40_01034 [candidate division WS2 bacterium]|nr:hypothetical protein [Candidatus Psychracetigena formicireducens]